MQDYGYPQKNFNCNVIPNNKLKDWFNKISILACTRAIGPIYSMLFLVTIVVWEAYKMEFGLYTLQVERAWGFSKNYCITLYEPWSHHSPITPDYKFHISDWDFYVHHYYVRVWRIFLKDFIRFLPIPSTPRSSVTMTFPNWRSMPDLVKNAYHYHCFSQNHLLVYSNK